MVDKAKRSVERENAVGFFWGHAGDGNLHLGLMFNPEDPEAREAVERVNRDVVEHGNALEYMRRIKKALDPKGILNPGKMLPEPE